MSAPRYAWGKTSRQRLDTCHTLLIELFDRVIQRPDLPSDLTVLCGHRGEAAQRAARAAGTSRLTWPKSKHNKVPSLAVDVAPYVGGAVSWDWAHYHPIVPHVRAEWAAMQADGLVPAGVALTWGGDWSGFKDGPHWQLDGLG